MRRRYVVTYDVSDSKRLRRTFKVLRGWGDHLQFSVFECLLTDVERIRLEDELKDVIHHREDQVLLFDLGVADPADEEATRVIALGRTYVPNTVGPVIV